MSHRAEALLPKHLPRRRVSRAMALVFLHAVLVTLLNALTVQKLTFLYKEVLHLSATDVTTLSLLINLPAYLQPLMGVGSDLFPLFGFHRRSYFLLAVALHLLGYAGLGYLRQYHYVAVACLLILKGAGAVLSVVLVNAAMVAVGNETGVFGRLQSVNQFVPLVMALLFSSHLSGWVCQSWTYSQAFLVAALVVLLKTPLFLLLEEPPGSGARLRRDPVARAAARQHTAETLRRAARSPGLWAITGYVFYLILTPGQNTTRVFYETDVLRFSKQLIGDLGMFGSAGAIAAILSFALASRRMPVLSLVWGAWLMDCLSYLGDMLLRDPNSACAIHFMNGYVGTIYNLCLFTLAARACPPGIEGTVYGLVMATIQLAAGFAERMGASVYDFFGPAHGHTITHGWYVGLWFGLGFTVLGALFIPFLPKWALSREPLGTGKREEST